MAYDSGELDLQAKIFVRMPVGVDGANEIVQTTTGRILLSEIVPASIPFDEYNRQLDKKTLGKLLDFAFRYAGSKDTVLLADSLRTYGYTYSTIAGISVCIDDMKIPEGKVAMVKTAQGHVAEVYDEYSEGLITDGERYNKIVDIWSKTTDLIAEAMMKDVGEEAFRGDDGEVRSTTSFNSIYIMADSGARGSQTQMRQLAGIRGLMAKPSGEIIETPITANFREGLTVLQYFISTHGARKGLADTALKTANSGYLTRRLVDVAQDVTIKEYDCGTLEGIEVRPLVEGGEVVQPLRDRILGRVALEDIVDEQGSGNVIVPYNGSIDEAEIELVDEAGIERVKIRSALTCRTKGGLCALCYGRDLARGKIVNVGEAIGVIAAQSIGEPGTQLTMRTFHIGGAASGSSEQSQLDSRSGGIVTFDEEMQVITRSDGTTVVMSRKGKLVMKDESGRVRETLDVIYGAQLHVVEGQEVAAGAILAKWDPWSFPFLAEVPGVVKFGDMVEGVTMTEQLDEVTGLTRKVVIEPRDPELRPRITIKEGKGGKTVKIPGTAVAARHNMPVGANIVVTEGQEVQAGDELAKIPRETTKSKDITGGLPRVEELFEARRPKERSEISEIDGRVSFAKGTKGKRKIIITPALGQKKEYNVPKGKYVVVHEGDYVKAGEALMDGASDPHDILRVLGEKELSKYLVDEVQQVYRLQGVRIHDKHIEVIVRQMLRWIRISNPGDTRFLTEEQVEKWIFEDENERVIRQGLRPATGEPVLLGVTKASLSTNSFLSASSFQETTKVLAEAAVEGKVDWLRGLKENVVMGRLVPAGTGFPVYRNLRMNIVAGDAEE